MKLTIIANHKEKFEQIVVYYFESFIVVQEFLNGSVISKQVDIALQAIYNIIYVNQKLLWS